MKVEPGNLKPSQEKVTPWSGAFLITRLMLLIIVVPLSVPIVGCGSEAILWSTVLSRIDGIGFNGNFFEALALSAALGAFAMVTNLFIGALLAGGQKLKFIPDGLLPVSTKEPENELKTWADYFRTLPKLRQFANQVAVNALGLVVFSHYQPAALHFAGPAPLLLTSAFVSATWTICMTFLTTAIFVFALKQRTKSALTENR